MTQSRSAEKEMEPHEQLHNGLLRDPLHPATILLSGGHENCVENDTPNWAPPKKKLVTTKQSTAIYLSQAILEIIEVITAQSTHSILN